MHKNISHSEENYIKSIFHLQQQNEIATTNDLAKLLNASAASVSEMLKKLHLKKIIEYEKYKGFGLSKTGNKYALAIVRKHRLWECFLVDKLNFGWQEVHEVAEELEHISSDKLIDRLDDFLGNPKFDPHGDPIPNKKGVMPLLSQIKLSDFDIKKNTTICAVKNQSNELLDLLKQKNIEIGVTVRVIQKFSFDNSIELKINNKQTFTISHKVASLIYVLPQ